MATAVLDDNTHVVDVRDGDGDGGGDGGGAGKSTVDVGDGCGGEIVGDKEKRSSEYCVLEVDLGSEVEKVERDCRICHLSMDLTNLESIELGCSCKDDLAAAHNKCAQAWFNIKGNKTCEICGSIAHNVVGANEAECIEHWDDDPVRVPVAVVAIAPVEMRNFWQGHRFLNFLLACMVFAFVISWLFHFNMPA